MYSSKHLITALLLLCSTMAVAQTQKTYMAPETFVAKHMPPTNEAQSLWVTGDLRALAEGILGHRPLSLRERYWQDGSLSLWILEEIGKEQPITVGFAIQDGRIIDTQVLIFRESRGWEIRYPKFTAQFSNAVLDEKLELDRSIDGISGATLSVNAMRKLARLALVYHQQLQPQPLTIHD